VEVVSGNIVHLEWRPPDRGPSITGYKLTVIPLSDQDKTEVRKMDLSIHDSFPVVLSDLTPGASYEIQLHSKIRSHTSNLFLSANFTTKPSAPGRFIVWFRNETTLLVLWQPPYPSGIFDQYRVSITPEDAVQSVLYVVKGAEPPGPAQASFYGLVPGRAYNISVQTVSHDQISAPTEAQYRTVPLSPTNITFDRTSLTTSSFDARWQPPKALSEFDRYQVSLGTKNTNVPKVVTKDAPRIVHFDEELEPGKTYEVAIKTVSGNVASWPLTGNITTRPLPVVNLKATPIENNQIEVEWQPNNKSIQDSYMLRFYEVEAFNSDGVVQVVHDNRILLEDLLAGRNYSIVVVSVSNGVSSEESIVYQPTKPSPPVIGILEPVSGSKLNVSWKSDVTSRQDSFQVVWIRNDTKHREETQTKNNWYLLEDLYPGAGYEIKVYAVSYGLISEPHSYFQTIFPKSPENLQAVGSTNSSILLTWVPPEDSLVDNFVVKYRPVKSSFWREITVSNITSTEIKDLVAGERYIVRVTTVSNRVESPDPREIEQVMYPNIIDSVLHEVSAYNITFHWKVPFGAVDYYIIVYNTVNNPSQQLSKQVANKNGSPVGERVDIIIDGLIPGEAYSFYFYTVSNNLRSEGFTVQTRTSEYRFFSILV
jgi:cadherin 5 type 2 (VE-cadherin)